jgi:hypothetical protein
VALEGSIEEFGMADILQLLYIQKKTGVLEIASNTDSVSIYFLTGAIIDISSKKMSVFGRMADILMKKNYISKASLANTADRDKKEGAKYFLHSNLVSLDNFTSAMMALVIDTLVYMFTWKSGHYNFLVKKLSPSLKGLPSLDTQHLLMESMRIIDELSLIEGRLDLNVVYGKKDDIEFPNLNETEARILECIDGKTDLNGIIGLTGVEYVEAVKAFFHLEEEKYVAPLQITEHIAEEKVKFKLSLSPQALLSVVIIAFIIVVAIRGIANTSGIFNGIEQNSYVEHLKVDLEVYYFKYGHYPKDLSGFVPITDRWGKNYIYKPLDNSYQLFSAGPDGIPGNQDDLQIN